MDTNAPTKTSPQQFYDFCQLAEKQEESTFNFPFKTKTSLLPFIERLKALSENKSASESLLAKTILEKLEDYPELAASPLREEVLMANQEILSLILSLFFNPLLAKQKMGYVMSPFSNRLMFATPDFMHITQSGEYQISLEIEEEKIQQKMVANAYNLILSRMYDKKFDPTFPGGFTIRNKETGLEQHFQLNVVPDFVKLTVKETLPEVSLEQVNKLYQKPFDQSEWLSLLPPSHFEFHGILIIYLTNITQQETKARIKNRLLGTQSSRPEIDVPFLRTQIRSFFNMADLEVGFQQHRHLLREIMNVYGTLPVLLDKIVDQEAFDQSAYGQVKTRRETIIIDNLQEVPWRGEVEELLLEKGIKSLMLVPIFHQSGKEIGGILELGSRNPGALSHLHLTKIRGLLPIFSAGLDRKKEEMENRLRQIIQQKFTSIHNSVQWKFTKVSLDLLSKQMKDSSREHEMAPLLFEKVYPLYGQADIIGSSAQRNKAILSDLCVNLETLSRLLKTIAMQRPTHLVDYFQQKVDQVSAEIEKVFSPSDETRIMNLLKLDIHPYLKELLETASPELQQQINYYFNQLHEPLNVMYHKRRAFEESVVMLNDAISKMVQEEDDRMQAILPHYFEKYKTDGVEFNIYLGQSILQNRTFSKNHLREFRLWQLILMARITQLVQELKFKLPMPLATSQLVFVYSDPLDIRFRQDEKRFDVDGAYNVRYEILKKRIDKAFIEGTKKRLTQEGKIAIVYLHRENQQEYLEYLDYMVQKGLIEPEIEEFNLARMQGVEGLKALRVQVRSA